MRVFDNLENYDIPTGCHLSVHQEEQFAKDIRDIVNELNARKSSKLQTRRYFKQCLRYTSNVNDFFTADEWDKTESDDEGHYKPLEGEYQWDSNLLHPCILDVLNPERAKFGYIFNLIHEDMVVRGIPDAGYWQKIDDDVIRFALRFDVEDITEHARSIENPSERIAYLNRVKADAKLANNLYPNDQEWVYYPFMEKLDILIEEAESAYKIWKDNEERSSADNLFGPVYVPESTQALVTEQYVMNKEQIIDGLVSKFNLSHHKVIETIDLETLSQVRILLENEFSEFISRLSTIDPIDTHSFFDFIDKWEKDMKECIDYAYYRCPQYIYDHIVRHEGEETKEEFRVDNLLFAKMSVQALRLITYGYKANVMYNNRESTEIFYILWKGGCERLLSDRQRLADSFGKVELVLQRTDVPTNIKLFYERLLPYIKYAIKESLSKSSDIEDSEKTAESFTHFKEGIHALLKEFITLITGDSQPLVKPQFEVKAWIEITKYCVLDAFWGTEWKICSSGSLSQMCNASVIVSFQFDLIERFFIELWDEYISRTGDEDYDNYMNDLGSIIIPSKPKNIPDFDLDLVDDKFFTYSDWEKALGIEETAEEKKLRIQAAIAAFEHSRYEAIRQLEQVMENNDPAVYIDNGSVNSQVNLSNPSPTKEDDSSDSYNDDDAPTFASCHLRFYDGVSDEVKTVIFTYMHSHVGFKPGVEEMIIFRALDDLNLVMVPDFDEMKEEFPAYSSAYKNFNFYLGYNGVVRGKLKTKHEKKVNAITAEIESLIR